MLLKMSKIDKKLKKECIAEKQVKDVEKIM